MTIFGLYFAGSQPVNLCGANGLNALEAVPLTRTGWQANMNIGLEKRGERTVLADLTHSGPLRVQRPFYPEGDTCHIYLLHL